jgi:hypothetical protein
MPVAPRVGAALALAIGFAAVLAGCGSRQAAHLGSSQAAAAPPPSASTPHSWLYRVGQDYAYEEDVPGQVKPVVQTYRYLGQRDGVFTLQFGGHTVSCANPCQVIHVSDGGFHVERLAFDPNTIIGAALTDAFNGQMQVYDPAKSARP